MIKERISFECEGCESSITRSKILRLLESNTLAELIETARETGWVIQTTKTSFDADYIVSVLCPVCSKKLSESQEKQRL